MWSWPPCPRLAAKENSGRDGAEGETLPAILLRQVALAEGLKCHHAVAGHKKPPDYGPKHIIVTMCLRGLDCSLFQEMGRCWQGAPSCPFLCSWSPDVNASQGWICKYLTC